METKRIQKKLFSALIFSFILLVFGACQKKTEVEQKYKTQAVILIVVDGARFSETWGDSTKQNIPFLANMQAQNGIINTHFYNNGVTKTEPGHTAITTGCYQEIDNTGKQIPNNPSYFQYYAKQYSFFNINSWIIASKDKLFVLANSSDSAFKNKFMPHINCGVNENGTGGYRNDSITYNKTIEILSTEHPKLVLINFREPDYSAHLREWDNYIKGIQSSYEYAYKIWKFVQEDSIYAGKTTVFITNDHGRHLDTVSKGWGSHGDGCDGCRHLLLYASGPDFRQNVIADSTRNLVDISATIAELLNFDMPTSTGNVMWELFE